MANKTLPQEITLGLQQLIEKAESGQDLKPHLSTRIDDPDYRDLMFYDWGIFHFHLGTNPDPKHQGFVERTHDLLFAIADSHTATMYLIDIHPHLFTNQDLLRILEENWPEIIEPYALKRCVGLPDNDSDSNIQRLREAGINTILQTPGGRFLRSMGEGITSAGNSSRIKTEAHRIKTKVCQLEELLIQQPDSIAVYFSDKYGKNWHELEFKLKSFKKPERIEEITTGEMVEIQT